MIAATLESIERQNDTTYTFWFKPPSSLDYTAGQFVEIFLPHEADDRGTHRWFTLSSSPSEPLIAITTRKVPDQSSFKKVLFSLQPGDTVNVSQAMGDFVLPIQKAIPVVFLVRGIGVTPIRSILKSLQDNTESRPISLIYSVRDTEDALFTDLLSSVTEQIDLVESTILTDVRPVVQKTLKYIKESQDARVYVSGPEQFVEKAYEGLLSSGIKASSIVTDYFHGYES
jgi:glycine betaine catabolism B